jgi:2-keto-4-pentenoate hydratase/2-oxohepta-3-ene-1,7-dioic acid hydratase in catechol pathway
VKQPRHALASVQLHAPLARPGKIVAIGRNYADHAKETGVQPFEKPRIISKLPSSVCDPGATVPIPADVKKMDFEAELAVVIGSRARLVSRENALQHVAAYCCLNDLSAREFQFDVSPAQTTFAKSMDGFCPLGPVLLDAADVANPQDLWVRSWVNDELMQEANTHDMLFPVAELIHYISQYMTLEPGDVLATGTPAGIGAFRTPPVWLKRGDTVRVEVSGMGSLVTPIG